MSRHSITVGMLMMFSVMVSLGAQEADLPVPARLLPMPAIIETQAPYLVSADPLEIPPELTPLIRRATMRELGVRAKLQSILDLIFKSESEGGMGLSYDNSRTRTITEVLRERRANCISLTALFVASCHCIGIAAHYAEPQNLNHWRRDGGLIRLERHVVGLIPMNLAEDLVADFSPQLRGHNGNYLVSVLKENRVRALYHSNRAVELLMENRSTAAMAEADQALKDDPTSGVGWNIRGVVMKNLGNSSEAEMCYLKAVALNVKDPAAIGNLELLMREMDRPLEAAKYREMGLDSRKKDPYFQAFLAEEALSAEQWKDAISHINAAIKLQPYESNFYWLRARISLHEGNASEAMKFLGYARRWALPGERERYDTKIALLQKG